MSFDNIKLHERIVAGTLQTPIGEMNVGATEKGICLLEFRNPQRQEQVPGMKPNGFAAEGENDHILQVKQELKEYFVGIRKTFDVPLDPFGTGFQLLVWKSLLNLPFGTTTTYMKQALMLGNPKAVRAVAAANGQNKIAIVIPCHRVIGSDGKLTGYAGGLVRKRWLLEFEARLAGRQDNLLF